VSFNNLFIVSPGARGKEISRGRKKKEKKKILRENSFYETRKGRLRQEEEFLSGKEVMFHWFKFIVGENLRGTINPSLLGTSLEKGQQVEVLGALGASRIRLREKKKQRLGGGILFRAE